MSENKTALEMIVSDAVQDAVVQVTARANDVIDQLVSAINANPTLPDLPAVQLFPPTVVIAPPAVDKKSDALDRAGRSFVGGAIVTGLATIGTEIGKLATGGAFDPLDGSSWKTAGLGLIGALGYAAVAYVQRFFSAPRS